MATCTVDMCVGTHRQSAYTHVSPCLHPLGYSRDKLFQALSHFFILEVTESWAGPGNEGIATVR